MGLLSRTLLGGAVGSGMGYLLSPEEQKIEGAIAGGLGGAGGGLLSRFVMIDPTKLGTFGGSLGARNLASKGVVGPQQALTMAEEMAARGASRDEIWDATAKHLDGTPYAGVFKGVDGKWRFEIDDSGAALTGRKDGSLPQVLDHSALLEAYPDMRGMRANALDFEQGGSYRGKYVGATDYNDEMVMAQAKDPEMRRSVLLHEAGGHGVQSREGFARGGNALDKSLDNAGREAAQKINERYRPQLAELYKLYKWDEAAKLDALRQAEVAQVLDDPLYGYRHLSGEVEARNVQTRDAMRRRGEKPGRPWETQDVPDDQQIVRFGAGK